MSQKQSTAYVDPSEPGSLGGVNAFAKAHKIPQAQAKQQLEQLLSYTLHKPRRRRFPTLPTKVFSINEQSVMDLVDLQTLAKYNKGYKYLLTVIDVFFKYAWVEPLKSKRATALVEALQRLWTRLGPRQPQKVQTDPGGEFYNVKVQAFFKKQGINHFSTHGDPHGSVVARWNRTLKTNVSLFYCQKHFEIYRCVTRSRQNRSIQEKPVNVTAENEHEIWYRLYGRRRAPK